MEKTSLAKTSPRLDSPPKAEQIIRQRIVEIAEITGKELTPALVNIWIADLGDIEPDILDRELVRIRKTVHFFPTPGDVRAVITGTDLKASELEAEEAWHKALNFATHHFHPDIGIYSAAPDLSARIEHAIRAAGGVAWLHSCAESDLVWCKRRFVEDFLRVAELEQSQYLLRDREAKDLLRAITTGVQPVLSEGPK